MTLEIGLGYKIEACRVAELIPAGIVGIVGGAHGIDVELLHDANVLTHAVDRHDIAAIGVELMTVDALDEDGLAVDKQLTALDLNMTESDMLTNHLKNLVALARVYK